MSAPHSPDTAAGEMAQCANATAVLHEIAGMVAHFLQDGQTGAIDLSTLPLSAADYQLLREVLADGEVRAAVNALGVTEVRETHYPGVWWLTHCNVEGEVVADLIEVTRLPEILPSQREDVEQGLGRLTAFLAAAESH